MNKLLNTDYFDIAEMSSAAKRLLSNTIKCAYLVKPEYNTFISIMENNQGNCYSTDFIGHVSEVLGKKLRKSSFFSLETLKNIIQNDTTEKKIYSADNLVCEISKLNNETAVIVFRKSQHRSSENNAISALMASFSGGIVYFEEHSGKLLPVKISKHFCEMLDMSEEECSLASTENGFVDLVFPDDMKLASALVKQIIKHHHEASAQFRLKKQDGKPVWVNVAASFYKNENGVDIFYAAFSKADEIKELESQISDRERKLMEVLDFSDLDYCEFNLIDKSCAFGGRTCDHYGCSSYTKNFYDAIKNTPIVYKDDRHLYLEMLEAVSNGAPYAQCEVRMLSALTEKYVWIKNRATTVFEGGKPVKAIGVGVRIDEFKEIQQRFNQALMQNGISTWLLDIRRKKIKQISDFGENDPIEAGVREIDDVAETLISLGRIYIDDIDAFREMYRKVWNGENNVKGQIRMWSDKYQTFAWFEYNFTYIDFAKGTPVTALVTIRDISIEKTSEQQYEEEIQNRSSLDTDIVAYFRINLTKEITEDANIGGVNVSDAKKFKASDFKERIETVLTDIQLEPTDFEMLSAKSLKLMFVKGTHEISRSYWAKLKSTGEQMWIRTDCRLTERQSTGDVVGFFYNRNLTHEHLTDGMLSQLAKHSYERSAAIFVESGRLQPIIELTAGYFPWWDGKTYDDGMYSYCVDQISVSEFERMYEQLKLDVVIKHLETEASYKVQYDIINEYGEPHRKQTEFSYLDKKNGVIFMSRTDIAMYEELRYLSEHDSLTGLYNRRKMFDETRKMITENPDEQFAFIQIDINRFKLYNSTFGEKEGDKLLKHAAELLSKTTSIYEHCVFGRMQSDVFYVCVAYDKESLLDNLNSANDELKKYRRDYMLRFSIGVYLLEGTSPNALEEASAKAAIAARKCKMNINLPYCLYDETEDMLQKRESEITNEMHLALENGEFIVYLQPKYALSTGLPYGAEALVRWNRHERGMTTPGDFIPIFEKNGFIADLDKYMWEQVCRLLRKWLDEGYEPAPVSVNVSRVSLYNPNLTRYLVHLADKYGIDHSKLHLEITESAYMSDQEMMQNIIDSLHNAGFVILMDDFGSGYSSLNTLKDFHVDILKIDMKFLPKDKDIKRAEIILASVVHMAKWLGMDIVMEGVETEEQRTFMEGMGCDYVQGFYYAKPMPADEYEQKYIKSSVTQFPVNENNDKMYEREIIIIEDNEFMQNIIYDALEKSYHLSVFETAEDALSYIQHNINKAGLIIVDNILPGMHGIDFLEFCKTDANLKSIPQILITSDNDSELHARAIRSGADDYILKPISSSVLAAYADKWMSASSRYTLDAIRTALNQINDAAGIFKYHGNTAYLEYANEACYKMFNTTAKETIGCSYTDLINSIVVPEDRQNVFDMLEELRNKGISHTTYRTMTLGNRSAWIQISGKLIRDTDGLSAYITYADVTEHQQMLEREKLLTYCRQLLSDSKALDENNKNVLIAMRDYYGAKRICAYELTSVYKYAYKTYEFAEGSDNNIITDEEEPSWLRGLELFKAVIVDGNTIAAPINCDNSLYGCVAVYNPTKNTNDTDFLESIVYTISQETHERILEGKLLIMSYNDQLTGLNNRNAYIQRIDNYAEKEQCCVGIVFADVNGLKLMNDTYGHSYGDELIISAGKLLVRYFRKENVYRISGDEFVIIVSDIAEERFNELVNNLKNDELVCKKSIIALGALWNKNSNEMLHLVSEAEKKMYKNKREYYNKKHSQRGQ